MMRFAKWLSFVLFFMHPTIFLGQDCSFNSENNYREQCSGCKSYFIIGMEAYQNRQIKEVVKAWEPLLVYAEGLQDYELLACIYPKLSKVYNILEQYSAAIQINLLYLDLPEDILVEEDRIRAHSNLSELYSTIRVWEEAYTHHLNASQGALEYGDQALLMQVNYQSGSVFFYEGKHEEALGFYQTALDIAIDLKKENNIPTFYGGLTVAAMGMGDTILAQSYAFKQLQTAKKPRDQANAMKSIAGVFKSQHKIDSALVYYSKALEVFQTQKKDFSVRQVTKNIADVEFERKHFDEAKKHYLSAIVDSSFASLPISLEVFQNLATIYDQEKNHEKSTYFLQKYVDLQEQFADDGEQIMKDKLNAEFQLAQKEARVKELEQENKIRRLNNFLYLTGFLSMLLIVFGVLWAYRLLKRVHRDTNVHKTKIEKQNEELILYNQRLQRFNSVVSHDLKQPLRTTISMIGLLTRRYLNDIPEKGQEYIQMIKDHTNEMYKLIEGLLQLSTLEKPAEESYENVNSHILASTALNQLNQLSREKSVAIVWSAQADNWPDIFVHPAQFTQVWQNLLTNAIKFSSAENPIIEIGHKLQEERQVFYVKDNGIGIAPEFHQKIFEMFNQLNTKAEFGGNGIGLATCQQIIQNHHGKIWVESEVNQGATFFFSVSMAPKPSRKKITGPANIFRI